MRELLSQLDRWVEAREEIALATLVRVHGSAPRLPGARLCLTRSGRMAGSVSGGCVENDVFERALQVLDTREPVVASYGIADEMGFEVGLSCGGTIDVLIELFAADRVWTAVREAVEQHRPAAFAIGLAPAALIGHKLALLDEARVVGSIDAALDATIVAAARATWLHPGTQVLHVPWRDAEASVFVEMIAPPLRLFIVGATHTASALCRMAKGLGYWVSVIDARGTYATRERFPEADQITVEPPGEVLDRGALDAYTDVVVLTHDPKFDIPALACALRSASRYIGVMGSRLTQGRRVELLQQQGFTELDLRRIRAPIGLDLGAQTPEEIALAILAEMVAAHHGRDGRPLCEKKGAIHGAS